MNSLFERPFTFDRVIRILFSIVIIGGLFYLITILRAALLPFLIAWLLAYMTQPFVKFFQYKLGLKSRILSIIAVIFCALLVISAAVAIVVPSIAQEVERTLRLVRTYSPSEGHVPLIPESWIVYLENNLNANQLMELLSRENIQDAVHQLVPKVWNILSGTFSILFSITIIFLILLYFIFILLDYEKIVGGWIVLIPKHLRPFAKGLADDVEQSMNRYFRGQSLIALCVGILFAIGFKIVGFPLGVSLGLFIGVLNLIPYLQTIGLIPMIMLSLLKSAETGQNFWIIFGSGLLVMGIVQCIQDLYLTPKIMGKTMGLNPAIILLSLSIWGTLLGFIGLIIALPLTTLCLSYYKRFILQEEDIKSLPTADSQPKEEETES